MKNIDLVQYDINDLVIVRYEFSYPVEGTISMKKQEVEAVGYLLAKDTIAIQLGQYNPDTIVEIPTESVPTNPWPISIDNKNIVSITKLSI